MATLKEEAQAYQPKQTLNVADLNKVDLHMSMEDRSGTDADGKEFSYKVLVVDNKEYRVPASVLEEIQKILKLKPDVKYIKVKKSGSGLSTRYAVDVCD